MDCFKYDNLIAENETENIKETLFNDGFGIFDVKDLFDASFHYENKDMVKSILLYLEMVEYGDQLRGSFKNLLFKCKDNEMFKILYRYLDTINIYDSHTKYYITSRIGKKIKILLKFNNIPQYVINDSNTIVAKDLAKANSIYLFNNSLLLDKIL